MNLEHVNEGSTAYLTFVPKDKDGVAQVPSAVTWKVDDEASGSPLQAETSITPATSMEITLTPAINTLLNQSLANEVRVVTVEAVYGASDAVAGIYRYYVDNLRHT